MFPKFPEHKYDFQFDFGIQGVVGEGYGTDVERFGVQGSTKRSIKRDGKDGIGDADLISEFYQAKQYLNSIITAPLTISIMVFWKIFDRKLPFWFVLSVKTLSPESRLRSLQLCVENARLIKEPALEDTARLTMSMK